MVGGLAVADVPALEDGTHLLHVGPQKTGSTALQFALHEQREVLREHGVVYPGPGIRPRYALGAGLGYSTPRGGRKPSRGAWRRLLQQVDDPTARVVCVSHEAFGRAPNALIAETVRALGGAKPHVLVVARGYDRLLPSQWQQRVKARISLSYDEWLRIVFGPDDPKNAVWRNVWRPHDTVALARRWAEAAGDPERVTVLVADDRDRSALPTLVERLLDVPAGLLAPGDEVVNRSLSYSEVELLRAVNLHFEAAGYSDQRYHRLVNHGLIKTLVRSERDPDDPSIPPLPTWAWEPLVARSRARVEGLAGLGVRVVGDPDTLLLPEQAPAGATSDAGNHPVPFAVAARALVGLTEGAVRDRSLSLRAVGADPSTDHREGTVVDDEDA